MSGFGDVVSSALSLNPVSFIQSIGDLFNPPEKKFKHDVVTDLKAAGMDEEMLDKFRDYLDEGSDEEEKDGKPNMQGKLQQLMAANPQYAGLIQEVVEKRAAEHGLEGKLIDSGSLGDVPPLYTHYPAESLPHWIQGRNSPPQAG